MIQVLIWCLLVLKLVALQTFGGSYIFICNAVRVDAFLSWRMHSETKSRCKSNLMAYVLNFWSWCLAPSCRLFPFPQYIHVKGKQMLRVRQMGCIVPESLFEFWYIFCWPDVWPAQHLQAVQQHHGRSTALSTCVKGSRVMPGAWPY